MDLNLLAVSFVQGLDGQHIIAKNVSFCYDVGKINLLYSLFIKTGLETIIKKLNWNYIAKLPQYLY